MGARFADMNCPIARTLDLIGERWTLLILRDLAVGLSRFDTLQRNLGISRKVLTQRLAELVEDGIVARTPYQDNPPRYDYALTAKGADLVPVLMAMKRWGDRWVFAAEGSPLLFRHEPCGAVADPEPICPECGKAAHPADYTPLPGPGFTLGPGTTETGAVLLRLQEAAG